MIKGGILITDPRLSSLNVAYFFALKRLATATKADDWHYLFDPQGGNPCESTLRLRYDAVNQRDRLTDPMRHIE